MDTLQFLQAASHQNAKSVSRGLMTLPEQIAERIFSAIASGEYGPGDRIREEVLSEQFGVSRGPVREALRILEKDAVVRIVPNRGAHVTQLSIQEVCDIFEIRIILSRALVARLTTESAAAMAAAIGGEIDTLEALASEPDATAAYFSTTFNLSRTLRDTCTNARLGDFLGSLARQTLRYTQLGLATPERRSESARNWRALYEALKAGDLARAADAGEKLMDDARKEAVRQLEADNASQSGQDLPGPSRPID